MIRPRSIHYHRKSRQLEVEFDAARVTIPAELLRVYSPSAEVRGHSADQRRLPTGKKYVTVTAIEPVGNYAVRLTFDDGHDSGLFSWEYLLDLGQNQERYWRDYDTELKAANASRLPTIPVGQWTPGR
ncbi:MAG: DUF971 domain-containing protein [Pseudomonadales bacterium]